METEKTCTCGVDCPACKGEGECTCADDCTCTTCHPGGEATE